MMIIYKYVMDYVKKNIFFNVRKNIFSSQYKSLNIYGENKCYCVAYTEDPTMQIYGKKWKFLDQWNRRKKILEKNTGKWYVEKIIKK